MTMMTMTMMKRMMLMTLKKKRMMMTRSLVETVAWARVEVGAVAGDWESGSTR